MTRPYVLTAMSKGFGRERILFRDALPNIVPIVITSFGMDLGFMAQAAIIVEPITKDETPNVSASLTALSTTN